MNNTLFGKGKGKILECFYKHRSKEIYFSEILRDTALTQNTTLKHLRNLQEINLILSEKKIGNTFYTVNKKNPEVYSVFSFFDYKRFNALPSERKRAIREFLDGIRIKPLILLVFGSIAKGTFGKDSDIDLLLVYNKKEFKDLKLKRDIESTSGVAIQPFIIDFDYFKEQILRSDDKLISHAIKTGFVMSGHYLFYKGVLHG